MHKPRYVVVNQHGEWQIKQAGRHFSACYASKSEALSAAIGLAEQDGAQGHTAEVLVRQEDEHFVTERVFGQQPCSGESTDAERPPITPPAQH